LTAVIVIAKAPEPGRVKTRLSPPLDAAQAAEVAAASLRDTLRAVAFARPTRRVLALEGSPGAWLPNGFEVIPQRGRGLDQRIAAAFDDVAGPAVLIGMDTPQVPPGWIARAAEAVRRPGRAVFGAATDGGWWVVGLHRPDRRAFLGVPMSTASTGAIQRARLRRLGLSIEELPPLRDIDRIADAVHVARQMRGSHLAVTLARCLRDASDANTSHARAWDAVHACATLPLRTTVRLREEMGPSTIELRSDRWHGTPNLDEQEVLHRLTPPVLDVGCGPGRHVRALAERGVMAMGVDISPRAVRTARARGLPVLQRSIFDVLPGTGRWGSALVMDGSIGIGGDPVLLLRRLRDLLRPAGSVVVELGPSPSSSRRLFVRVLDRERVGQRFPWAEVGADAVGALAGEADLAVEEIWSREERWFAHLRSPAAR
jgi:rSAM/selenodomain-associated transferase 1